MQAAHRCLGAGDLAGARRLFEGVIAANAPWYHALARTGLATVARLEGRPWDGIGELRRARERLDTLDRSQALWRVSRRQLAGESSYCLSAMGLPDLAAAAVDELRALAADATPDELFGLAIADIDQRLACMDWRSALQRAEAALGNGALAPLAARANELRLRKLVAGRRLAADRAAHAAIAAELETLHEDVSLQPALRRRAGIEAAEAWLAAGELARAQQRLARIPAPSANLQYAAEAQALQGRLAIAAGSSPAAIASMHDELAAAVAGMLAEMRSAPVREGGDGMLQIDARQDAISVLLALDRLCAGDQGIGTAFEHLDAALAVGALARRFDAVPVSLQQARRDLLPERGGLLAFWTAPAGGHVLAIDRARGVHSEFQVDDALRDDLQSLRHAIEQPPADRSAAGIAAMRGRATRVADRLLPAPVRSLMDGWDQLVVLGDEGRTGAVVQALPWRDTWLCLRFATRHLPSCSLAARLHERSVRRRTAPAQHSLDLAVVGDPSTAPEVLARWRLSPVDLRPEQRAALLAPFAAGRTRACWGADATAAALEDPLVQNARMLCVVAHGIQDFERERFAGILLAAGHGHGGEVFAESIEKLAVPPAVILATCHAASGPRRVGDDGQRHLGGALLLAGADSVVLAGGDLSLGATLDLLATLFAELQRDGSGAGSLRSARRAAAGVPGREHPYYFAGLRWTGLDSSPLR